MWLKRQELNGFVGFRVYIPLGFCQLSLTIALESRAIWHDFQCLPLFHQAKSNHWRRTLENDVNWKHATSNQWIWLSIHEQRLCLFANWVKVLFFGRMKWHSIEFLDSNIEISFSLRCHMDVLEMTHTFSFQHGNVVCFIWQFCWLCRSLSSIALIRLGLLFACVDPPLHSLITSSRFHGELHRVLSRSLLLPDPIRMPRAQKLDWIGEIRSRQRIDCSRHSTKVRTQWAGKDQWDRLTFGNGSSSGSRCDGGNRYVFPLAPGMKTLKEVIEWHLCCSTSRNNARDSFHDLE
jgi:hypothetical protein